MNSKAWKQNRRSPTGSTTMVTDQKPNANSVPDRPSGTIGSPRNLWTTEATTGPNIGEWWRSWFTAEPWRRSSTNHCRCRRYPARRKWSRCAERTLRQASVSDTRTSVGWETRERRSSWRSTTTRSTQSSSQQTRFWDIPILMLNFVGINHHLANKALAYEIVKSHCDRRF